jgi:dihydrodipicolinate synthase/N-acetylneuraminate lyase
LPPQSMYMGGQLRLEMALAHFKRIADATDLPMICFQYPMGTSLGYPFDTWLRESSQSKHRRSPTSVAKRCSCNDHW